MRKQVLILDTETIISLPMPIKQLI